MDSVISPVVPEAHDQAPAMTLEALFERVDSIGRTVDALKPLLALAGQAPALIAAIGDSADDLARKAAEAGIDIERGVLQGAGAALRFGAAMDAEKVTSIDALLKSGVLDPNALRVVGEAARALAGAGAAEPTRIGPAALLTALRRPDVQRALGFLITFAERFGRGLLEPHQR